MFRNFRVISQYFGIPKTLSNYGPLNVLTRTSPVLTYRLRNIGMISSAFYCQIQPCRSVSSTQDSGQPRSKPRIRNVDIYEHTVKCNRKDEPPPPPTPLSKGWLKYVIGLAFFALGAGIVALQKMYGEDDFVSKRKRTKGYTKTPPTSVDIPDTVPYLMIGGGTTSFVAASTIMSKDSSSKVLIISSEEHFPYIRNQLSRRVSEIDSSRSSATDSNGSLYCAPPDYYVDCSKLKSSEGEGGVAIARGWRVNSIDVENKRAFLDDGYAINYEKCLIATGSSPMNLPVFEKASQRVKEKVILFYEMFDFEDLERMIRCGMNDVAVVGGGFVGTVLASCLAERGKKEGFNVHHILAEHKILNQVLPEYLCEWTSEKMRESGINVIESATVKSVYHKNDRLILRLSNGQILKADCVIVAIGSKPNTDLAVSSGLPLNPSSGALSSDEELLIAPNIWAAGDCATIYDMDKEQLRLSQYDNAVLSGKLAGENMTGAGKKYAYQPKYLTNLGPHIHFEAVGDINPNHETVAVFSAEKEQDSSDTQSKGDLTSTKRDFKRGVIFYLKSNCVVGIVLWNLNNLMPVARRVLCEKRTYDDLNEIATCLMTQK